MILLVGCLASCGGTNPDGENPDTPENYTVTYDADGGNIDSATQTVTVGESFVLATASRDGYTFLGWYSGDDKMENGKWTIKNNVTLKAKWEITSCVINENTVIIADGAFSICNKLESVTIPNSVEFIGNNAFAHCRSLQTIVIPQSVKVVDGYLIYGCTSMKTVYCGAQSQPNGWYSDWNADGVKVVWGYQG
jgi:uncharacterized repeat protein (TIGR02543 family)